MSERRGLLSDISWLQVIGSALAAVTAAWLASRLGVAGTMIGVALGSFVATIGSAVYARTLDKGKTLLVHTASGAVIQKSVQDGDIAAALEQAAEVDDSPVRGAEVIEDERPRLRWKRIVVTSLIVIAVALTAISTYEVVSGRTLDGSGGTTIGDTFGGSRGDNGTSDDPSPTPTKDDPRPTPEPSTSISEPEPTRSTPTPRPTASPTPDVPPPTQTPPAPEE